ncbi:MAG: hypothetical protein L0H84_16430, partial [Pseudonocardia sp.]|nr:hypothetical protein [Pseudonocardia sp.]
MGDGADRARRGPARESAGRAAAVHDDNVLARHGLVGGGPGAGTGGRRRRPEPGSPEPQRRDPARRGAGGTANFLDDTSARGRAALESSGALQRTRA